VCEPLIGVRMIFFLLVAALLLLPAAMFPSLSNGLHRRHMDS
jgi:hypothetical protein